MLHTTSNPTGATLNGKLMNGGSSVMTGTGNSTGNNSSSMIMTSSSNTVTGSSAGSATATTAAASAVNAGPLDAATKRAEREHLRAIIAQWNANRLDLFEISEPNEVSHMMMMMERSCWQCCHNNTQQTLYRHH